MTKDVIITITGFQCGAEGRAETPAVTASGEYYEKNGKHYIVFEEKMEGFQETTKNRIKLSAGCLDITKRGAANVHMVFEPNKKNTGSYHTPYGTLLLGLAAKKLEVTEETDHIYAKVAYALEINDVHTADCEIQIDVSAK